MVRLDIPPLIPPATLTCLSFRHRKCDFWKTFKPWKSGNGWGPEKRPPLCPVGVARRIPEKFSPCICLSYALAAVPVLSVRYECGEGNRSCVQEISDYYGLVAALRERRIKLGLPHLEVDDIAGFQSGYTGKLERPQSSYGRHARWPMLEWWMESLGVALVPVRRPGSIPRKESSSDPRQYEFRFR